MDGQKLSIRQIFVAVVVMIGLMIFAGFNNRWNEKQRLTLKYENALRQRDELLATQQVLRSEIEYASSDAAVEEWAYSEGGMSRPGDIVIQPLPAPGAVPTPTPPPPPVLVEKSNFDVWWSLFFDTDSDTP